MKMPDMLEADMLAPCGMNCAVCYVHVGMRKHGRRCAGCLRSDEGKPEHCRVCKIKTCAAERGFRRCHECGGFPCKLIKNLEKSYKKRYHVSLVENSLAVRELGLGTFMERDRRRWTCVKCGGAFSLHDGICSECGEAAGAEDGKEPCKNKKF